MRAGAEGKGLIFICGLIPFPGMHFIIFILTFMIFDPNKYVSVVYLYTCMCTHTRAHTHTHSSPCLFSTYLLITFSSNSFRQKKKENLNKEWEMVLQFFVTDMTLGPLEFFPLLAPYAHFCYVALMIPHFVYFFSISHLKTWDFWKLGPYAWSP